MNSRTPSPHARRRWTALFLAAAAFLPRAGHAATAYYVDNANPSCSDAGAGTEAQPFCTISGAVAARRGAGITILVKPGTYREQVTLPASGAAGDTFALRALGTVVIDGADDKSVPAAWGQVSGNVWLATSVSVLPKQVFVDGVRLVASTAAPASMPSNTYQYVAGTGLYVNVGGGNPGDRQLLVSQRNYGFRADKRSWISIEGFTVTRQNDRGIYLTGPMTNARIENNRTTLASSNGIAAVNGSQLVIDGNRISGNSDHGMFLQSVSASVIRGNEVFESFRLTNLAANGIHLTGSAGNTLERNRVFHNQDSGYHLQSSSNGNVFVQNLAWGNGDHGFDHLSSTGNRHVGDVASANYRNGFMFQSSSGQGVLANCVAAQNGLATGQYELSIDALSSLDFASDDNLFWSATGKKPVMYAGAAYSSVAAYSAASGKDGRTLEANPLFADTSGDFRPLSGSPLIDAANSSVAGWPATDAAGVARFDDPAASNTGIGSVTFADRGAFEFVRVVPPAPNVCGNPSFETNTAGWNGYAGAVLTRVAGGHDGAFALSMTGPASRAAFGLNDAPNWTRNVVAGQRYRFTAWVRSASHGGAAKLQIREFFGPSPSVLQGVVLTAGQPLTSTWQPISGEYTVTTTGSTLDFQVLDVPLVNGETFETDDIAIRLVGTDAVPVVTAPATVTVDEGTVVTVNVTASDADGEAIATLAADLAALPLGHDAVFTAASDRRSGTLTWTTTRADSGAYPVTFTASNALSGTAVTSIRVVDVPDRAPVLTVPASVSVSELSPLVIDVAVSDPDGDAIATLAADLSGLPAGHDAVFTPAADRRLGRLTWTPTRSDSGTWSVTFTAGNALSASSTTTIQVIDVSNLPPVAVLSVPATFGIAPHEVNADASGSHDTDGTVATYRFDFGDGTVVGPQASPLASHTYAAPGERVIVLTVTDDQGGVDTAAVNVAVVTANLAGNPSFETNTTGWNAYASATLTRVAGGHDGATTLQIAGTAATLAMFGVNDSPNWIVPSMTTAGQRYRFSAWVRSASSVGKARLQIREYFGPSPSVLKGTVLTPGLTLSPTWQLVTADYTVTTTGATLDFQVLDLPVATGETFQVDDVVIRLAGGDTAPTVTAPAAVSVLENAALVVDVTVVDPDADAITSLSANLAGLPAGHGATFVPSADHRTGRLTWTPSFADSGTYTVSFTAANALSGGATTSIQVQHVDRKPAGSAPASVSGTENVPLTIDVTAADPDGEAIASLTADLSELPSGHNAVFTPSADQRSGQLTWTPTFGDSGSRRVRFVAANALAETLTTLIQVVNFDRAPVVTAPPALEVLEGQPVTVSVSATDADGEAIGTLAADLAGLPAGHGAVFTPDPERPQGTLTWTPSFDDSGTHVITFLASNTLTGSAATTIHVTHVDRAPVVVAPASASVLEGQLLTVDVTASDPDGDAIAVLGADLAALPAGHDAVFTPSADRMSGTLTWTPTADDSGRFAVRFSVANGLAAEATTVIEVGNVDRAPVVTAPADVATDEDAMVTVVVTAADHDGDAIQSLSADLSALPAGNDAVWTPAADQLSGALTWTPGFADSGVWSVAFTATNARTGSSTTAIRVSHVDRQLTLSAPVSVSEPEGGIVTVNVTVSDPDAEPIAALTADLSGLPAGHTAVFTTNESRTAGTLTWSPGYADAPGPYVVTFHAANGGIATASTSIAVVNRDRAPVLTAPSVKNSSENLATTVDVTVADPDGDPVTSLTADLSQLPAGHDAVFTVAPDQLSGTLTWTPTFADSGVWDVTFTAANESTTTAVTRFLVANVDRVPVVTAVAAASVDENDALTITVSAVDPDGDDILDLAPDLSVLPSGHDALWTPAAGNLGGALVWTPTYDDAPGPYAITFSAVNAATGTATTTVTVGNVDRSPQVIAPPLTTVEEEDTVTIVITVADPDGDPIASLTADVSQIPPSKNPHFEPAADNRSARLVWTPSYDDQGGPYLVTFTAVGSQVATATTQIAVTNVDRTPAVSAPEGVNGLENQRIEIHVTAEDPDGEAIATFAADLAALPAGHDAVFTTSPDLRTGVLTWTPTFTNAGVYDVTFTAANGIDGYATTQITVGNVDRAPVLTLPAPPTLLEGAPGTVVVTVADPDGDPIQTLAADLAGLPAGHGATFTPAADQLSGTLAWTPSHADAPGPWTVSFTASNALSASAPLAITVENLDRAPVVTAPAATEVVEGQPLSVAITAVDPDGDAIAALTANLANLPSGHDAVFTPAADQRSGVLTWTPSPSDGGQSFTVSFDAANALAGTATTTITVDRRPVLSAPPTVSVQETSPITFTVTVVDPDGDPVTSITADLAGLPPGNDATFTVDLNARTGTFRWTPTYDDATGPYSVSFAGASKLSTVSTTTTAISVIPRDRAPVVMAPGTALVAEGSPLVIDVTAADPDGEALTGLSADFSNLPAGHDATFAPAADHRSGRFTWTPTLADGRGAPYFVQFTADNGLSGTAATAITVDRAPEITVAASANLTENAPFTLSVTAADPDGHALTTLTADLSGLPAGHDAVFTTDASHTTGTLTWTPTHADSGSYTIGFTAANTMTGTASTSLHVLNVDRAPVVTAPAAATGTELLPLTVTVSVEDPDGDAIGSLDADLSGLPAGSFTPSADRRSGTLSWTPEIADGPGPHTVAFTAANALSGAASTAITVQQLPVVTAPATVNALENDLVTVTVTASDPDGQPLTGLSADLSSLPAGHDATFVTDAAQTTGTLTWRPTWTDGASSYPVTFTAQNDLSRSVTTTLVIANHDRAPVVTAPATAMVAEGAPLTLSVTASDPDGETITALSPDLSQLPAGHGAVWTPNATNTGGTLSWTPTLADGRVATYAIAFTAQNALSGSATTDVKVDQAPEVTAPAAATVSENAPLTVTVTAVDPDGEAILGLTADLSQLPAGHDAVWTPNGSHTGGTLTWTPTFADARGTPYPVTFTAQNLLSGAATTAITVSNLDRAPVVAAPATAVVGEGAPLTVNVTASDIDGEAITSLTADLGQLPAGHDAVWTPAADRRSGTLTWTPTAADGRAAPYVVAFTASNALSGGASVAIRVDQPPVVTVAPSFDVDEDELITVHVAVADPDGETIASLTADLANFPAGSNAAFTADASHTTGTLTWRPTFNDAPRTVAVTFTAANAITGTASTALHVLNSDRLPILTAQGSVSVGETSTLTVNVTAADPDGEAIGALTANLTGLPAGHNAVFAAGPGNTSGTLTWTPTFRDAPGPYVVAFSATNAATGTASTTITVTNVDRQPVVAAPATLAAGEGVPVSFWVTASDPDLEPITAFTANLVSLPPGENATFTPTADRDSALFTWTPSGAGNGPYPLTFTAQNALAATATTTVTVDRAPRVTTPATATGGQGQPLVIQVTVADPDNETIQSLVANLSGIPASETPAFTASADRRSGTFTWTPSFASGAGPFQVSFTATNALTHVAHTSITIDQAPVITSTASVSGTENVALEVTVGAVDPDGHTITALTADLSGLPAGHGAVFTPNAANTSGTLRWTPSYFAAPGPHTVTFRAQNALSRTTTSSITVSNVDRAPVMTAPATAVIGENAQLSMRVLIDDPDLEPITALTANLSGLPAGNDAAFTVDADRRGATLTWRPEYGDGGPAPYVVSFQGGNVLGASASTSITVETRPVVTAPSPVSVAEGTPLTITVLASDGDGQPITSFFANFAGLPAGHNARFTPSPDLSSGVFTWTPTYDDSRTASYYVTFTASNNFSGAAVTAIRVVNTDRAPVVTAPATTSVAQGAPLTVSVTASDPDGQALISLGANLSSLPAGHNATFTPNASFTAGTLTWTPTLADGGRTFTIPFTASNVLSGSASTVITVDRHPTITVPATAAAVEGSPVTVTISASDPDGQPLTGLTASLTGLPAGHNAVFAPNATNTGGTLTWTPSYDDSRAAPYVVTFTASNALQKSGNVSITVSNTDRAPVITGPATFEAPENAPATLTITAADPDGQPLTALTASLAGLPAGHDAVFTAGPGNASGTLTWTPTFADSGTYTVSFTAANGLSGSHTVALHVRNSDRAPVVTAPAAATGSENGPLSVEVTASDPDGDAITQLMADLAVLPAGHGATFTPGPGNTTGTLTWTPDFGAARANPYAVTFTAGNAMTGAGTTAITVTNVDRIPTLTAPAAISSAEGTEILFTVNAGDPDGDALPALTADLAGLPPGHGATFTVTPDNRVGTFRWTPSYDDAGGPFGIAFSLGSVHTGTEITVAHTDRGPVVTAPATLNVPEGQPIVVRITAADPEGEAIASLTANLASLPAGHDGAFAVDADRRGATFTWTPTFDDAPGPYAIAFTASNALTGSATLSIAVNQTNRPPVAALTMDPTTGLAPVTINASASGSTDPDGTIVSYTFDFGDGTIVGPQASPTASHVYAGGNFTPRVIVEDNQGGRDTAYTFVNPYANLCANGTFETNLTGWAAVADSIITRTTPGHLSAFAMKMIENFDGTSTFGADDNPNWVATTDGVGSSYHFEAWVRAGSSHGTARIQVREMAGTTVRATVLSTGVTLGDPWQHLTLDYTVQFAGTSLDFRILNTPVAPGENYMVDDILIRKVNSRIPVVTVSPTATVDENGLLSMSVTASDPDGEPLDSLKADLSGLPAGHNASFTANATANSGTLTWTPTFDHGRATPYTVTFTAKNSASGTASSAITVTNVDRAPMVVAPSLLTSGEGAPITLVVSATDPDGQPVSSVLCNVSGLPAGHNATFTADAGNGSGTLRWTPTYEDSGAYTVSFTAANALSGSASTTIRVTSVDRAPLVTVASRVVAVENGALQIPVTAVDLDGQAIQSLTANLSALPAGHGATFTVQPGNGQGTLDWTPPGVTPHGPFVLAFTAENVKSATATCTLFVDHHPVIGSPASLLADENAPATFAVTVTDQDGDAITSLTADLSGLPSGHNGQFTVNATRTEATFTWTPTHADAGGPYPVVITAVNGHPVSRTTQITVGDVDAAPVVTAPTNLNGTENQPMQFQVTAADPDGQGITSLTADLSGVTGATFTPDPGNATGTLRWTPSYEMAPGPYHVTFTASNALTGTTKTTIAVANVDRAPVLSLAATATAPEATPFTLTFTAIDPDGQPVTSLTASLAGLPPGHNATFTAGANNGSGTFAWTPTYIDAVGPYQVAFTAANALTTTQSVAITVQNTDRLPIVSAPIVGGGPEGQPVVVDVTASDPDGAAIFVLSANLSGLPAGHDAQFVPAADNRSGRLTWTPAAGDSVRGPFNVTFTATNAGSGSAGTTLLVGSQDFAPMVSAPSSVSVQENGLATIQVATGDPNGTAIGSLSANLSGLPVGHNATFTPNATNTAGTLTWRPTFGDGRALPYSVTFTAANSRSGSVTTEITVVNVDRAPVVTAPATAAIADGSPVTVTVTASDPDGQAIGTLAADLSGLPAGHNATFTPAAGNASGTLTWTPTASDVRAQAYTIGFTASNTLAGGAFTAITVNPRDRAPVITVAPTATHGEGSPITITLSASDPDGQPITSLTADLTALPAGHNATFTPNGTNTGGTFTWTPSYTDARPSAYNVVFRAANGLTGTATTAITVTNTDRAPAITAPATLQAIEGQPLTFTISANDLDGTAITSLTANLAAFPAARMPSFSTNAGRTSGTFTWTPAAEDVRGTPYQVTFTAANALTGTATTAITVAPSNLPPAASLVATPGAVVAPGAIAFTAAGSTDPDGTIATYFFDFGDGQTLGPQAAAAATHAYGAGLFTATVIVTDDKGASDTASVEVSGNLANLVTNFGFETNTTGWAANGSVTLSRITSASHAGAAAMQLRGGSSATATFGTHDSPNVVSAVAGVGRRYRFGAWVRGATATDTGTVRLEVREFTGTSTQRGVTAISSGARLGTAWQYVTVDYVVTTAGTNLDLRVIDTPKKANETWFLDDVSIALVPLGDQAPMVTAPASTGVTRNHPLTVNVTASDPDGHAITGLTANLAGLPAGHGAVFTPNGTNTGGTLTWTPREEDIRPEPYVVIFTASNALTGIDTTLITVRDSVANVVTNPGFETDLSGWASYGGATLARVAGGHSGGFAVQATGTSTASNGIDDTPNSVAVVDGVGSVYRFTAWIRSDNSTRAVKLRIYEMNGATQVGGTFYSPEVTLAPQWKEVTVDYTVRQAGTALSLRITNYPAATGEVFLIDDVSIALVSGAGALLRSADQETDAPVAETGLTQSRRRAFPSVAGALALDAATGWSVRLEGFDGPAYEGAIPAITLQALGRTITADPNLVRMGDDIDANGFEEIEATFPIAAMRELLGGAEGAVDATLEIAAGTPHAVTVPLRLETIATPLRFEATFGPNPMRVRGTLRFAITRQGPVRADLFDASGRRVRTLLDRASAEPGRFTLELDGRSDGGDRLPAGMYFYRVQAAEGRLGGRVVIVP